MPIGNASAQTLPKCLTPLTGCPWKYPTGSLVLDVVENGGFEDSTYGGGDAMYWVRTGLSTRSTNQVHCGSYSMLLSGGFFSGAAAVSQQVNIPAGSTTAYLDFWAFFPVGESDEINASLAGTNIATIWSNAATSGVWTHTGCLPSTCRRWLDSRPT
jgi:hypothetical protein